MKNLKFINCIILLLIVSKIFSQEKFTAEQYAEDIDYLCKAANNYSVSADIYSKEHKIDRDRVFDSLKLEFTKNPNLDMFLDISQQIFNLSADAHNGFIPVSSFNYLFPYLPEEERKATLLNVDTLSFDESRGSYNSILPFYHIKNINKIRTVFNKGKYYLLYDTYINGIKVPRRTIIHSINRELTNDFVAKRKINYFIKYSQINNTYYTDNLFSIFKSDTDTINIKFFDEKNNKYFEHSLTNQTPINTKSRKILTLNLANRVKYLNRKRILYFKLENFNDTENIRNEILKYKDKKIEKIIFDVRNNGGGSDLEWLKLLSLLSNNLKINNLPLSMNKNNTDFDNIFYKNTKLIDTIIPTKYSVRNNDIFDYFEKDKAVIDYKGDFYCIINDYSFSAALTFASLKYYLSNFYVVGEASPYYGGFGYTPLMFMMPNTKLMFRMASNFDYKLFNNDVYITPDIKVEKEVDEDFYYWNTRFVNFLSKLFKVSAIKLQ